MLLLGFIPDAERFLLAFDVFLLSSVKEGLSYVLIEAGFAKIPVVATGVGGIPEIIKNDKTGILVPSHDPVAISNAISRLFESSLLREKLGLALNEKVVHDFSSVSVISETTKLYTS